MSHNIEIFVSLFSTRYFTVRTKVYNNKRHLKAFGIGEVAGYNRVIIILSDCPKHQIRLVFFSFGVIPRRLSSKSRRFGTLYRFRLQGQVDEE